MIGARIVGAALVAATLCAVTASSAGARVAHDPCAGNPKPHRTHSGIHCGGVFEVPGHRTIGVPASAAPQACDFIDGVVHHWDYWTKDGQWVLWTQLMSREERGRHGQIINVDPDLHNFGSSPWSVRVFFKCGHIIGA